MWVLKVGPENNPLFCSICNILFVILNVSDCIWRTAIAIARLWAVGWAQSYRETSGIRDVTANHIEKLSVQEMPPLCCLDRLIISIIPVVILDVTYFNFNLAIRFLLLFASLVCPIQRPGSFSSSSNTLNNSAILEEFLGICMRHTRLQTLKFQWI